MWSWVPTGPESKVDCAGESQQQFTAHAHMMYRVALYDSPVVRQQNMVVSPVEPRMTAVECQQHFTSHMVWTHLLISKPSAREQYLG
jgi:hypothetical protein